MTEAKVQESGKDEELLVFSIIKTTTCSECQAELSKGSFIRLEDGKPLCMECADLSRLSFLPAGNVAVTRRAKKYSDIYAVVLQFSRARKRYERQGLLLEEEAIEKAWDECEKDADKRAERREIAAKQREIQDKKFVQEYAARLAERYPNCPPTEAREIAEHACQKYSGRVGRSASAKEFDPETIDLAVRAHIRHCHTKYDSLLSKGHERSDARRQVAEKVDEVMANWAR